jgi:hypothetical protein
LVNHVVIGNSRVISLLANGLGAGGFGGGAGYVSRRDRAPQFSLRVFDSNMMQLETILAVVTTLARRYADGSAASSRNFVSE